MDYIYVILPAIAAGFFVSLSHTLLGQEVLKRGIIFIDLAIAQIAALGDIVARIYFYPRCDENHNTITSHNHHHDHNIDYLINPEQALAFGFAILAAYFFMFIEKKAAQVQEAVIGCSFIAAISAAILIIADQPHGEGEIEAVLAGQLLWASWDDIISMAAISLITVLVWFTSSGDLRRKLFFPLFAICVTFSVQIIGVYLVFASLIFPALATYKFTNRKLLWAYVISALSYITGIKASYHLDLPSSPTIIIAFTLFTAVFMLLQVTEDRRQKTEDGS